MDSLTYTPVKLPYFIPSNELPMALPSWDVVQAADDRLNGDSSSTRVVRLNQYFVAKWGPDVSLLEGDNLLFVRKWTSIPVPNVYAMYKKIFNGVKVKVIIMENIEGHHPGEAYLTERKDEIAARLRAYLHELRSLPLPPYYGRLGCRPYLNDFGDSKGPFRSAWEAKKAYFGEYTSLAKYLVEICKGRSLYEQLDTAQEFLETSKLALAKYEAYRDSNKSVFTHGALGPHHIIIRPDGTPFIIGWGSAGYYLRDYEYYCAMEPSDIPSSAWQEIVPNFLESYEKERKLVADMTNECLDVMTALDFFAEPSSDKARSSVFHGLTPPIDDRPRPSRPAPGPKVRRPSDHEQYSSDVSDSDGVLPAVVWFDEMERVVRDYQLNGRNGQDMGAIKFASQQIHLLIMLGRLPPDFKFDAEKEEELRNFHNSVTFRTI
ncbi:hypothetical protein GGS26DRAFT_603284 [Hypomontagnella submonticulosa]|nr:hypothetical protein GGS26DRAFT_603284 [Hypomontagnella submonticulosa]